VGLTQAKADRSDFPKERKSVGSRFLPMGDRPMGIGLSPLLDRFAERTPLPVLARAVLERGLNPPILDDGFAEVAEAQYTRHRLFSTLLALMSHVVLRQQPSIHAAYRAAVGEITVSVTLTHSTAWRRAPRRPWWRSVARGRGGVDRRTGRGEAAAAGGDADQRIKDKG
jgi:hypothetical protein